MKGAITIREQLRESHEGLISLTKTISMLPSIWLCKQSAFSPGAKGDRLRKVLCGSILQKSLRNTSSR